MALVDVFKSSFNEIISSIGENELKVLCMDNETIGYVTLCFTQTELLSKNIFYFERLDSKTERPCDDLKVEILKAVVLIRPTDVNISLLENELRKPRYGSYYIYFVDSVTEQQLKLLARSDVNEVINDIKEYYMDYYPMHSHVFSLNISVSCSGTHWLNNPLKRTANSLATLFLSKRKVPIIIYQKKLDVCQSLANNVNEAYLKRSHSQQKSVESTKSLLIILHRSYDPVTPLLFPWTYQAMLHELYGISKNSIDSKTIFNQKNVKDLKDFTLNESNDLIFARNIYLNYGDLAVSVKRMIDEYKSKTSVKFNLETVQDMKQFVDNYPQMKKVSTNITKHVTLATDLSEIVEKRKLLKLSEFEQNMVTIFEEKTHFKTLKDLLNSEVVDTGDAFRMLLIFMIRYRKSGEFFMHKIADLIEKFQFSKEQVSLLKNFEMYCPMKNLPVKLFDVEVSDGNVKASIITKKIFKEIKGIDNIYTQYKPLLGVILSWLFKNKLSRSDFGILSENDFPDVSKFSDVNIFVVGGITYQESKLVHDINQSLNGTSITIGGTCIHNSKSFINEGLEVFR